MKSPIETVSAPPPTGRAPVDETDPQVIIASLPPTIKRIFADTTVDLNTISAQTVGEGLMRNDPTRVTTAFIEANINQILAMIQVEYVHAVTERNKLYARLLEEEQAAAYDADGDTDVPSPAPSSATPYDGMAGLSLASPAVAATPYDGMAQLSISSPQTFEMPTGEDEVPGVPNSTPVRRKRKRKSLALVDVVPRGTGRLTDAKLRSMGLASPVAEKDIPSASKIKGGGPASPPPATPTTAATPATAAAASGPPSPTVPKTKAARNATVPGASSNATSSKSPAKNIAVAAAASTPAIPTVPLPAVTTPTLVGPPVEPKTTPSSASMSSAEPLARALPKLHIPSLAVRLKLQQQVHANHEESESGSETDEAEDESARKRAKSAHESDDDEDEDDFAASFMRRRKIV